ncbi:MAG: MlaD family protein [Fimbriiglobus sp.]
MSQTLSRQQALALGLVVLLTLIIAVGGLWRIGSHQGLWVETFEVSVGFPEVHDIAPGTAVRIRGVNAGQVVAIDYPETDGPQAVVTLRLRLDSKFQERLYADASASLQSTGLLSAKIVAVNPGTPALGRWNGARLQSTPTPDFASAAAKFGDVADEAKLMLKDVRSGKGSLGKLVTDEQLYNELHGLVKDSRKELTNVQSFVEDGRATMKSFRTATDGLSKMPLIRSYIEDTTALLVRPTWKRDSFTFNTIDIFQPGTAIMTETGKGHLNHVVSQLAEFKDDRSELVVLAICDPNDRTQTATSAQELTKQQAERTVEFLKSQGVHKIGWITRRKVTAVGMGHGPLPMPEKDPVPPSYVQVLVFTPQ